MLNMIRMELFRMFKTKSLYVIWTIFAVLMIVTTALTAGEMDAYSLEDRSRIMNMQWKNKKAVR